MADPELRVLILEYGATGDVAVTSLPAIRRQSEIESAESASANALAQFFRSGAGTAVQTAGGTVAALFSLIKYNHKLDVADYSLRIMNGTEYPVSARIWVVDEYGCSSPGYSLGINVEAFSAKSLNIGIRPSEYPSFDRAVAEIVGYDIHSAVEAAAPPPRPRNRVRNAVIAAAGVVALVVGSCATLLGSLPRIAAFSVPPTAMSGTSIDAAYSVTGAGTLSYLVETPTGVHLQGGTLSDRDGTLSIPLQSAQGSGAYTVQLSMQGPFTRETQMRVINVIAPRVAATNIAAIADISVTPAVAAPGQSIKVAYAATGTDGYVRLLGSDGTQWAQQAYSPDGSVQFTVPAVTTSQEMRVKLHVSKNGTAAESVAGLVVNVPVAKRPAPSVASATNAKSDTAVATASTAASVATSDDDGDNGTFSLAQSKVASGGSIHVQIISPRNNMRISLMDTQSHEVSGIAVGSDAQDVTLSAPVVKLATRYIVQASFTDGFGQESIVEPITVAP